MSEFVIFELPLLHGTLALSPIPGRTRHYGTDRERLFDWKPDMVLTMTTMAELERKGSGTLGEDLKARGISWHHLPIEDFGAPGPKTDAAWPETSRTALGLLANGGKVLAHCFGGCGRSGMACLRLMIEAGEAPNEALHRLRSVRPCAVETQEQLDWAFAGKYQSST